MFNLTDLTLLTQNHGACSDYPSRIAAFKLQYMLGLQTGVTYDVGGLNPHDERVVAHSLLRWGDGEVR